MREIDVLYGEDAQALRKKAGLTQTQLAERWGLTRQQIGRYEKTGQEVPMKEADAYRGLVLVAKSNGT
ncbi:helix-turn-helix domain-containing protein [Burkholderia vietnamiensis]|uniref:helix-turn-helix domain-containing protein n=1 Tax=Burkholderia vietnamiensis TaxID=60552 RepID=UPI001CF30AAB|nr:helix-turn-helix transcriptional regulator [Burkholderia vietnamiensis]MCA8228325.1 helix-turn-helix domain-containing protein [Burkholderia vietnamiensis]